MNKELKDCLLAIGVIAAVYSSMYLFYYASKYLGYIYQRIKMDNDTPTIAVIIYLINVLILIAYYISIQFHYAEYRITMYMESNTPHKILS